MRIKTIIVAVTVGLASVAASLAQDPVYSQNTVGYVNVSVPSGFSAFSNPLIAADNSVGALLPTVPDGTVIYKFNGDAGFSAVSYFFGWDDGSVTLEPGEGALAFNPTADTLTWTFIGDVAEGSLSNPVPAGFSLKASQVPQAGVVDTDLGLPVADGDSIFRLVDGAYVGSSYFFGWDVEPNVNVGEGFFVFKGAAANWDREFSTKN